jgi:hypothetical protein
MTRLLATAALAAALVGSAAVMPSAEARPAQHRAVAVAARPCSTWWEVTGKTVAVRRPAWNEGSVAKPNSPVDHYLQTGNRVKSCVVAIARTERGPAYHKCKKGGSIWRVVQGGQVPETCVKRV